MLPERGAESMALARRDRKVIDENRTDGHPARGCAIGGRSRDQPTRPCSRRNFPPSSVTATITPKPAMFCRATYPQSAASSQIVNRGHDVRQVAITSE